jgi:hypothetical protein
VLHVLERAADAAEERTMLRVYSVKSRALPLQAAVFGAVNSCTVQGAYYTVLQETAEERTIRRVYSVKSRALLL